MSTSPRVFELADHRSRRDERLQRIRAFLAFDPRRARLGEELADLVARVGGDRGVLAWVDELDSTLARTHLVIDLHRDTPLRVVEVEAMLQAWERAVPAITDRAHTALRERATPGSLAVASLGSDGRRAWFVLIESSYPRPPLNHELRDEFAYRAGVISGVLLHPEEGMAFDGWRVFASAFGDDEGPRTRRALARVSLLRFLRAVVADDFMMHPAELEERIGLLREEFREWSDDLEGTLWQKVVESVAAADLVALGAACFELGERLAGAGELELAAEVQEVGYEAALVRADASEGSRVARHLGRVHRNAGAWDDSERWYRTARGLARVAADPEAEAIALDGWANTLRVKGALPAARRHLEEALRLAERSGSGYALGSVHHGLMTIHAIVGETPRAIDHGWKAVQSYTTTRDQLRALVSVAGLLLDAREGELAEQAYAVALRHLEEPYYRLFALDGHAHAAALQGKREEYLTRSRRLADEDWRPGGPDFEGQVYLYRGRAWEVLGDAEQAVHWYRRALEVAEAHRLSATLFAAQDGLQRVEAEKSAPAARQLTDRAPEFGAQMLEAIDRADRRLAGVGG